MAKIRTTHTGSLHRPPELIPMIRAREAGEGSAAIDTAITGAVHQIVADQVAAGLDIVNDGEQSKPNYATYVSERFTGFASGLSPVRKYMDIEDFPDFAEVLAVLEPPATGERPRQPACVGPIEVRDGDAVHRDIANLAGAAAAAGLGPDRVFMSAISPGTAAVFMENEYYPTRAEYLQALGEALSHEYRAIVEAGFTLQIDCPDFVMRQGTQYRGTTLADARNDIALGVEVLNAAISDLPPEQMRIHLCWGNNEAPHVHDIEVGEIIDLIVKVRPAGIALEASNPRHAHEWEVFEEFTLPEEKYLLPGVIDTTTNFVEHPELVAQRLRNYTKILGNERVIGTTDCGFGTFAGRNRVSRSVAWAKLASMAEGAEIASR